jgi:hypothetical protein
LPPINIVNSNALRPGEDYVFEDVQNPKAHVYSSHMRQQLSTIGATHCPIEFPAGPINQISYPSRGTAFGKPDYLTGMRLCLFSILEGRIRGDLDDLLR